MNSFGKSLAFKISEPDHLGLGPRIGFGQRKKNKASVIKCCSRTGWQHVAIVAKWGGFDA